MHVSCATALLEHKLSRFARIAVYMEEGLETVIAILRNCYVSVLVTTAERLELLAAWLGLGNGKIVRKLLAKKFQNVYESAA